MSVMLPWILKNATGLTWREDLQELQEIMRLLHQILRNNWSFITVLCTLLFSYKIYIFLGGYEHPACQRAATRRSYPLEVEIHNYCTLLLNNVWLLAPSWVLRSSGHSTEHCILCTLPSRVRNLLFCSGSWARRSRVCWRRSRTLWIRLDSLYRRFEACIWYTDP